MSKFTFTSGQIAQMEQLPAVAKATSKMIVFTQEFKQDALNQFKEGKARRDILEHAGINTKPLGHKDIKDMFQRWSKQNLLEPPKPKGRPKGSPSPLDPKNMTHDQLLAKCALQEAEIEFLKKVLALD